MSRWRSEEGECGCECKDVRRKGGEDECEDEEVGGRV